MGSCLISLIDWWLFVVVMVVVIWCFLCGWLFGVFAWVVGLVYW